MGIVPVIDLSPAVDTDGKRRVANQIAQACEHIGFFGISGHGVDPVVIANTQDVARRFFDLPEATKRKVAQQGYPYCYVPFLEETLSYSVGEAQPPDLKESLAVGPLDFAPTRPNMSAEERDFGWAPSLWPAEPADFKPAMSAYYRAMTTLGNRLMQLFAIGLDLPETYFDPYLDYAISSLRILNYPNQTVDPEPGQLRAGAHSDYGTLTILLQDAAPGGLEVQAADGSWHPVPAVPGTFVINLGDMMARWTNDRWRSTVHRVANPPRDSAGSTRRQSIPFFQIPNWDAEVVCLPSCLGPGEKPKYPPVLAGPHLKAKYYATVFTET